MIFLSVLIEQHIEIFMKKVRILVLGIDTDPDRQALDADPDPDPQHWKKHCQHAGNKNEIPVT